MEGNRWWRKEDSQSGGGLSNERDGSASWPHDGGRGFHGGVVLFGSDGFGPVQGRISEVCFGWGEVELLSVLIFKISITASTGLVPNIYFKM